MSEDIRGQAIGKVIGDNLTQNGTQNGIGEISRFVMRNIQCSKCNRRFLSLVLNKLALGNFSIYTGIQAYSIPKLGGLIAKRNMVKSQSMKGWS